MLQKHCFYRSAVEMKGHKVPRLSRWELLLCFCNKSNQKAQVALYIYYGYG